MSAKVFTKLAAKVQDGATYEGTGMFLLAFTENSLNQNPDPIEDDSIVGLGFRDIPQQGPQHTVGSITTNLDLNTCQPLFTAAFGTTAGGGLIFSFGTSNTKKLSLCALTAVNAVQYANVYCKSLKINGSSGNLLKLTAEVFGVTAQDRQAITEFPASTTLPDTPFTFHTAGGTGYVRVGDAVDALSSSDNVQIEDFDFDITVGFDEQFTNEGIRTLTPEWGMVRPEISGSFTLARYSSATVENWRDNQTPLQMELHFVNSSGSITIQIPRFIIDCELTDDDLTKQKVTMNIGRNGVTGTYKNAFMAFASPMRITLAGA